MALFPISTADDWTLSFGIMEVEIICYLTKTKIILQLKIMQWKGFEMSRRFYPWTNDVATA